MKELLESRAKITKHEKDVSSSVNHTNIQTLLIRTYKVKCHISGNTFKNFLTNMNKYKRQISM